MSDWAALASGDDLSVNFVRPAGDGGLWEARYVRRCAEYAVVYLSSQSGCRQACRMCHLTATGQTMERGATLEDYLAQADVVLAHLDRMEAAHGRPGLINVNLMARGEPMANPHFLSGWRALSEALEERAGRRGMGMQLNVSTIMPSALDPAFVAERLGGAPVRLYYSLYATDPAFRRRWLPRAMAPETALAALAAWQGRTGGFNPPPSTGAREPSEEVLDARFRALAEGLAGPSSRQVPRVGFDVRASCGMFVEGPAARRRAA
jgi:adenine C2-methylase RlmN of 23S rRNA A2503 and tRNA A37